MKSKLFAIFFALPVTTGICGAILRASQIRYAYDPETGILNSGQSSTYGLIAVCIIAALMALAAAFLLKSGVERKAEKSSAVPVCLSLAAAVVLAYASLLFLDLQESFEATRLILGLFSVYCAVALLVMAKYRMAERESIAYCVFSAVPVFWACFMLILTFREKISDPIISNYVMLILSYISILFFAYSMAAHLLGKKRRHVAVLACFLGIFFILTEMLSPLFSGGILQYDALKIRELLPQLAFLILMPPVCAQIAEK